MTSEGLKRKFLSGEEWLYYKIYCGVKTTDNLLTSEIFPLLEKLEADNVLTSWFFIRYYDSDHHLRLRIRFVREDNQFQILSTLNRAFSKLLGQDIIWKVQQDTYVRELERYGYNLILPSEQIFYHDSNMILRSLKVIEGSNNPDLRWMFALLLIDCLMDDFKLCDKEKKELMGILQDSFGEEMGLDKNLKKSLNDKFRKNRSEIEKFLKDESTYPERIILEDFLNNKSEKIESAVQEILSSKLPKPNLYNLLASHIHMSMNRLFKDRNRQSEFVCYYFLFSLYKSQVAREKYRGGTLNPVVSH